MYELPLENHTTICPHLGRAHTTMNFEALAKPICIKPLNHGNKYIDERREYAEEYSLRINRSWPERLA